jgi:hypothetical protein
MGSDLGHFFELSTANHLSSGLGLFTMGLTWRRCQMVGLGPSHRSRALILPVVGYLLDRLSLLRS